MGSGALSLPRALMAAVLAAAALVSVLAGVFAYRFEKGVVEIAPPVVWFEDPGYGGVEVELYRHKTYAVVRVSLREAGLRLLERSGVALDLTNPDIARGYFTELVWIGCFYSYTSDGVGIYVTGNPSLNGYSGCLLAYRDRVYPLNTTVSFLMKTDDGGSPIDGIRGVVFLNSANRYYYMAGIKNNGTGWFFGIYKYTGATRREPGGPVPPTLYDVRIPARVTGVWFVISLQLLARPDGSLHIRAWLYNMTGGGRLVASIEAVDARPIQGLDTFGLGVYQIRNRPSAVFRMVGWSSSLEVLIVRGLAYCCDVYVYDSAGRLVGWSHVDETGVARVFLENSALADAMVRVVCDGYEYSVHSSVLLGGDVYELYLRFEGPILDVYSSLSAPFVGKLVIMGAYCTRPIYFIELTLTNQTHVAREARIYWVSGGLVIDPSETEPLLFKPAPGARAGRVLMTAETYVLATCTLYLELHYNYSSASVYGALEALVELSSG